MHAKIKMIKCAFIALLIIATGACKAAEQQTTIFKVGDEYEVVYAIKDPSPAPKKFKVLRLGEQSWILVKEIPQSKRALGAQQKDNSTPESDEATELWINCHWIFAVSVKNHSSAR